MKEKECLEVKITNLDKRLMSEGFEKDKGFMRIEFKIALITGVMYMLINFGPNVALKLLGMA